MMRLDKLLADMGIGTRSEVKKIIKSGAISINGNVVKDGSVKIEEKSDTIVYKGKVLKYEKYTYIMLNKPKGVISATFDSENTTVVDILPKKYKNVGIFPVGRLDKDTLGLLLLTNDGEFAHNTLSPKKHIHKKYYVEFEGTLPENAVELFKKGIELKDFVCKEAKLVIISDSSAYVTISEGKYHQVKRMFSALGCSVTLLKRMSFGEIELDESLKEGQCRQLNEKEMEYISKYCGR